jgi:hypothetical protein
MEGAERMEWRRSPAVSAPSRRWFLKVKRGKRSGRDTELVRGKQRRLGGASIKLRPSMGRGRRWRVLRRRFGWVGGGGSGVRGRRRRQRWAKLGPKQKRAGRLDGPPWRGGLRWARPENKNKTRNHMGFNGARAELRWAVEKNPFQILNQGFEFK